MEGLQVVCEGEVEPGTGLECAAVVVVVAVGHVGARCGDAPLLDFVGNRAAEEQNGTEIFDLAFGVVILSCTVAEG